jgi:TetR/AcrR family transcriptional regulator, transcriptional repressor for nem operon
MIVMSAIERCRTAALGGHVARCEGCAHTVIADNSCRNLDFRQGQDWTPASLAAHTQAVLQGAFILAKATGDRAIARESVDHLRRYIELLFTAPAPGERKPV